MNLEDYLKNIGNNPELGSANILNIDEDSGSIQIVKNAISLPILICQYPDSELPEVQEQINFMLPPEMKKSKESYVKSIKNDIKMYIKLYEKLSINANKIINETKKCFKNLYPPFKSLQNDINKYTDNFEISIKQLTIPLKNERDGIESINCENYSEDKRNKFIEDKKEIKKLINNFIKDANEFYSKYKDLNNKISNNMKDFVQRFENLASPAKELTTFMNNIIKTFEGSAKYFSDLKDKKKIDKTLQTIKEPFSKFHEKKSEIMKNFNSIKHIKKEEINEIIKISDEIKKKINKLIKTSKIISEEIKKIREKYDENEQSSAPIDLGPPPNINTKNVSNKMAEQQEKIKETASSIIAEMDKYIIIVNNQTRLDLLFIMDITNSMDKYLDQVKKDFFKMLDDIQLECAGSDIYLGFIGYKDFNDLDNDEDYINLEFTTNYKNIREKIQHIQVGGGGDEPEDLCGALELGKEKKWSGNIKFAILVTDSPCHGTKYHDLGKDKDNYPEGDRDERNIEDMIKFFAKENISLYCLKIENKTDKMFNIFKKLYNENKDKNSKNEFVLEIGKELTEVVTRNAINMFQNRDKLDLS